MVALRVAVVGAGPAGFYACEALLRRFPTAQIDILERLPVPFGLVRYGVAADHPNTRTVTAHFSNLIADNPRLNFYGNVSIGTSENAHHATEQHDTAHVTLTPCMMRALYHTTVYATGAIAPRRLSSVSIPHSHVFSAHDLVLWLNGHPDLHVRTGARRETARALANRMQCARDVTVIGVGNVAIDIARLLLRSRKDLANLDVHTSALTTLMHAPRTHGVTLVARRSPRHAAWSAAALREVVTKVPGIVTRCDQSVVLQEANSSEITRKQKRTLDILTKHASDLTGLFLDCDNLLTLKFNQSIESFKLNDSNQVEIGFNDEGRQTSDAAFLSLGYVSGDSLKPSVGWANGNASGIIGGNKWDAETVVASLPEAKVSESKAGLEEILKTQTHQVVTWEGWERIDGEEQRRAKEQNKTGGSVRIECALEMLGIAQP